MKFRSNLCGIFATAFIVATVALVSSCSQDDDEYNSDMYTLAEKMETRSGAEPPPYSEYEAYYKDPNNCGGVALAILYGEKTTQAPQYAYVEVKRKAGSCTGMSHDNVCAVGKSLGLYCNRYVELESNPTDSILEALDVNRKIVFIDVNNALLDHAIIGHEIKVNRKIRNGDTIRTIKITGEDRSGNVEYQASRIIGIIQ